MSRREAFVSDLMREDIARIMHAFKPLLLGDGIKEEVVDSWIANSVKELRDLSICGHIKWRYTVAIRNTLPWQTRLEVLESLDLPRQRMVVPKTPKGFVPVGCSTNITARVSAGTSTTSKAATVTPWTTVPGPGGVPLGPIAK
ncbi:hypothetical protein FRB90_001257 [Tulasnella sp. 427]|nr:hypothetical protein FRB90_001257 [Tulasnella sp. 427]